MSKGAILKIILLTVGITAVVIMGGAVVYQKYHDRINWRAANDDAGTALVDDQETAVDSLENSSSTEQNVLGESMLENGVRYYRKSFLKSPLRVKWQIGAQKLDQKTTDELLEKIYPEIVTNRKERARLCESEDSPALALCDVYIYRAGTIQSPQALSGQPMYLLFFPWQSMGTGFDAYFAYYNAEQNKFLAFIDGIQSVSQSYDQYLGGFIVDKLPDVTAPKYFNVTKNGQSFHLIYTGSDRSATDIYSMTASEYGMGKVIDAKTGKLSSLTFSDSELAFSDSAYGPVYLKNGCYHIVLPDGSVHNYEYRPYFLGSDQTSQDGSNSNGEITLAFLTANIDWVNGPSMDTYQVGGWEMGNGHCDASIKKCTNIVNDQSWFLESKLVEIGKTKSGEPIYELKDKETNPIYKKYFDWGAAGMTFEGEGTRTVSDIPVVEQMEKFLADKPMFFYHDVFGNWRLYVKSKYQSSVECGKPVIYLYPTQNTKVNVKVAPNGGLTKVDPVYPADGWTVNATPKSELTNLADGQKYPYLFWEGKAYDMITPDYGFVMSRAEVGDKMKIILAKLGLNKQETADFLEFWQSKLEVKPYVFVTFVPQSEFDKLAPLTITPRPDKVIRVFMDYAPLDNPINVREPRISTPTRTGFTVVEWGGRLR